MRLWLERTWPPHSLCTITHAIDDCSRNWTNSSRGGTHSRLDNNGETGNNLQLMVHLIQLWVMLGAFHSWGYMTVIRNLVGQLLVHVIKLFPVSSLLSNLECVPPLLEFVQFLLRFLCAIWLPLATSSRHFEHSSSYALSWAWMSPALPCMYK